MNEADWWILLGIVSGVVTGQIVSMLWILWSDRREEKAKRGKA